MSSLILYVQITSILILLELILNASTTMDYIPVPEFKLDFVLNLLKCAGVMSLMA